VTDTPNIRMIDVGGKQVTAREATAKSKVIMKPETFVMVKQGSLPKGDALATAKIAAIMAAKKTPELLPMCHPLLIEDISVEMSMDEKSSSVEITAKVKGSGKTGFEMEALTAVSVAALTIYDMAKGVDTSLKIENIRLTRKSGGKSGTVILE
jgi:cyclic pyranopterin monophosphate synthase